MNKRKYVTFALLNARNSHYSFNGYTDEKGEWAYISDKDDKDGNPIARRFHWSRNKRHISIPEGQKDRNKKSVVEFLKNSPECLGSPLQKERKAKAYYMLVDNEASAKIVVDSKKQKFAAQNRAFNMKPEEVKEAAIYLFGKSEGEILDQHKVLEEAERNPVEFLERLDSPDFKTRALIRDGISKGELVRYGKIIKWEDVVVGADEDDAVTRLLKDEELRTAIKHAIEPPKNPEPLRGSKDDSKED